MRLFVPGAAATMVRWQDSLGRAGLALDGQMLTSETLGFRVPVERADNDGSFGQAFGYGTMTP